MQPAVSRIWTLVIFYISNDDNHNIIAHCYA